MAIEVFFFFFSVVGYTYGNTKIQVVTWWCGERSKEARKHLKVKIYRKLNNCFGNMWLRRSLPRIT